MLDEWYVDLASIENPFWRNRRFSLPILREASQAALNECIGLLATIDFSGHGISPSPLRLRVTDSGLLGDSSLAFG